MYLVFLDEFGHIGPYVSRQDKSFKTSPVFGLAGFFVHHSEVRDLSHWFYKLKETAFAKEIAQAGAHATTWEKKGNELFTRGRVYKTKKKGFELLNQINRRGGKVIYNGMEKYAVPEKSNAPALYGKVLEKTLMSLERCFKPERQPYQVILDQNSDRSKLVAKARSTMYRPHGAHNLVELPYEVESHLYPTVQIADWISSIVGSLSAYYAEPIDFSDDAWAEKFFSSRLDKVKTHSKIVYQNNS